MQDLHNCCSPISILFCFMFCFKFYCTFYCSCDRSLNTNCTPIILTKVPAPTGTGERVRTARVTPAVEITDVTSSGHVTSSATSPFDSPWPLSYRLPIVNGRLSAVVSEMLHARCTKRHPGTQPVAGIRSSCMSNVCDKATHLNGFIEKSPNSSSIIFDSTHFDGDVTATATPSAFPGTKPDRPRALKNDDAISRHTSPSLDT